MRSWKTINSGTYGNKEVFVSVSKFNHNGVEWGHLMRETYDRSFPVPRYRDEYNTIHPAPQQVH